VHVKREVNTEYEIAAVTAKLDGKQAIFFENVRDSKIRITCNVLATPRRFCLALGGTTEKSNEHNVKKNIHTRVTEALNTLSDPERTQDGGLFEENSCRNLYDLPIVTHFDKDAGPFITSSIVFSENQEKGKQNQSTHRLLRLDDRHIAIRMVESRDILTSASLMPVTMAKT
jgi:2,5-furandicarboxylate decarboxylase 1